MNLSRRSFLASGVSACAAACLRSAHAASADALPDYWCAPLDAVASRVCALRTDGAGEAFFFFTDVHTAANALHSGALVAELVSRTGFTRAFCGGDVPVAYGGSSFKATLDLSMENYRRHWIDPIGEAGGLLLTAKGNHDFSIRESSSSTAGYTYSDAAARAFIMTSNHRPFAITNPADPIACYCYRDVPSARVRYIVADSCDRASANPNQAWGVSYGMHDEQLAWMADVAFGTVPDGWGVVVMQHIPCAPIVESGGIVSSLVTFRQLMEAYQNRGRISIAGAERDFASAGGCVLANITGHHHADRWTFLNGIHHVTIACDAWYNDYRNDSPFCGTLPTRGHGTANEHVVDAFQWDASRGLLHETRLGPGQNKCFHVTPVRLAAGATHVFTATQLTGAVSWTCYDGDTFTYNDAGTSSETCWTFANQHGTIDANGFFRAGASGSSVVVAMDGNLNKEIFGVTVT